MLQPKIVIDIFESHDLWCAGLALDICPKNSATTACKSQWANEEQQQTPITTTRSSRRPASCTRPIRKSKIYRSLNNWDIIEIILCVHNGTCWAVHIALHMYYYLMAWPGNIDKGDWWLSRTDSELHHHMYFIEYWIMKRNKHHNEKTTTTTTFHVCIYENVDLRWSRDSRCSRLRLQSLSFFLRLARTNIRVPKVPVHAVAVLLLR